MPFSHNLNEDKFETIFNISKDGIAILDLESNFVEFNPAYLDMSGFTREVLLQQSCIGLTIPSDVPRSIEVIKEVIKTGYVQNFEKTCLLKNGQTIQVNMALALLPDKQHILISTKDISEKNSLLASLESLSKYDNLTQLPNRYHLTNYFATCVENLKDASHLYLCFLDLDKFKPINDLYGHAIGDQLLQEVANRLEQAKTPKEMAARLGGDEFVMLLIADTSQDIRHRLTRLLEHLSHPYQIQNIPMSISASIGVSQWLDNSELDTLLRQADQAMYLAKQPHQHNIQFFSHSHHAQKHSKQTLLAEVAGAIKNEEMVLFYQPKVNLRTGKTIGLEALVRWLHPKKGLIPPDDFIPFIESTQLIIELDQWVIIQAFKDTQERFDQGYKLPVSINISNHFFHHSSFIPFLKQALSTVPDLPLHTFELELLESISISDFSQAKQVMIEGKMLGFKFSLDDFGTGYSSLSYLKLLPFDTVKIDKIFIQTMLSNPDEMAIVEAIINLANLFKMNVIAEGIESVEHGMVLLRYGCNMAQGYNIAKPMPNSRVCQWVNDFIPDPSWALWADVLWEAEDFPLLIAKSDHIIWVEKILIELKNTTLAANFDHLKDAYTCRFGQWYYGKGMACYQGIKAFNNIEPIHQEVHQLGRQMFELKQVGDIEAAKAKVDALLALRDDIIASLEDLHRQFILSISKQDAEKHLSKRAHK